MILQKVSGVSHKHGIFAILLNELLSRLRLINAWKWHVGYLLSQKSAQGLPAVLDLPQQELMWFGIHQPRDLRTMLFVHPLAVFEQRSIEVGI